MMSLYRLKGRLERTERDSETSSMLHTIWIKVHGVPDLAREVEHVKEIVNLVTEHLVVDELSLIKSEPVRVKGRCRNPGAIKGIQELLRDPLKSSLMVLANLSGLRLRVVIRVPSKGERGPSWS
jgi:hypothetical protein